jgi:hypothetical protein
MKSNTMTKTILTLAGTALVCSASLQAASLAYTVNAAGSANGGAWGAVGFEFTTSTDFNLTQLGTSDWGNDGLGAAATVTIWDTVSNVVATATIPTGTGADETVVNGPVTQFMQNLASPVTLTAGTYVIATSVAAGDFVQWGVATTPQAGINIGIGRGINPGGAHVDPRTAGGFTNGTAYIGPQFTVETVPEPSSLALLGLGGLALTLRRRR